MLVVGSLGGGIRADDAGAGAAPADATHAGDALADDALADDALANGTPSAVPSPASVRELAPGVFVHVGRQEDMTLANAGDIANGGFVIGERSVAVIDPGGGIGVAEALLAALRAHTSLPVSHVVLTHFHPDHVLGAAVFTDAGAATSAEGAVPLVVAHAAYARARTQRGAFYAERFGALLGGRGAAALIAPTLKIPVGESRRLDLGGRQLVVSAHPTAHTDNDLSAFDVRTGTLWAGDLLFAARTPALDGSLPGWLGVMTTLAEPALRLVVPGHGEPAPLAAIAAPQRRYLEELLQGTRAAIAAGGRLGDALDAAERAPGGGWLLFAEQHPTNVTRAWAELEWE